MNDRLKQLLIWISLVAYLAFAFVTSALLTNWFRYGPSIEALAVLGPLLLVSVAVLVLHLHSLFSRRRNPVIATWAFVSAIGGVLITLLLNQAAQGIYFPEWYTDHVIRNHEQRLITSSGELSYYLELCNPFGLDHQE